MKDKKKKSNTIYYIFTASIVICMCGLILCTIIFWADENIRTTLVAVLASSLSGLLTLGGVLISIKHQNAIRDMDEKLKHKPQLSIVAASYIVGGNHQKETQYDYNIYIKTMKESSSFEFHKKIIPLKCIINAFIFKGLLIDNIFYSSVVLTYITAGEKFEVEANYIDFKDIHLVIQDILGNEYLQQVFFDEMNVPIRLDDAKLSFRKNR